MPRCRRHPTGSPTSWAASSRAGCPGPDVARLYELFAGVERLSTAGRMLLAPRIEESGVWRDGGHRSPAVMLAELEGVPTGQARRTLEVGQQLHQLPETEEVLRSGVLSGAKVGELAGAAILDPTRSAGYCTVQPRNRSRACASGVSDPAPTSARRDPMATVRRIRAERFFSSWTDHDGAFCYQGRDTADRGAKILQQMEFTTSRLERDEDPRTATEGSGRPPGGTDSPMPSSSS